MATHPVVELKVGSTWTDITSYVRYQDMITIQRGRSAEASQVDTSTCTMTLNNRDGRFSPRNPEGTYYGQIGRNTPIRVSIDGGLPYLDLPGGTGDKSSTPDAAALDITGDIDVRAEMFLLDWNTTSDTEVMGKYTESGNQRSWLLSVDTGGFLKLSWSANGTTVLTATATSSLANNGRSRMAVRATLDVNNGAGGKTVTFYTADSMSGTWTQLGNAVTTATTTAVYSSTAALEIGDVSTAATAMTGRVYKAEVRDGIGGTAVANPDFTLQTVGASSFADAAGRTWTQAASASISNRKIRFMGEVTGWHVDWDISGTDVITRIEASGIIRRLTQGASPLRSPLFREMINPRRENIVGYWSLEDAVGSASFASGIPGAQPMTYTGRPELASSSAWTGSTPVPVMQNATFTGAVPRYTATGETSVRFLLNVPSGGVAAEASLMLLTGTGTVKRWEVRISTAGSLKMLAYDADNTELLGAGFVGFAVNGERNNVVLELTQDGADVDWRLELADYTDIDDINDTISTAATSGTLSSHTVGRISRVTLGGSLGETSVGHVSVADDLDAYTSTADAIVGWRGEAGTNRLRRLLTTEEDIPLQIHSRGITGNTVTMGVQTAKTIMDLVREIGETDLGIVYEPRDEVAIAYRSRLSLYNQDARLALDYASAQLASAPVPIDDDRYIHNDITVTRESGSSYDAVLTSGSMSIQAPPDGVGRYEEDTTISLGTDDQLGDQAGWRLHLGTVDEARYPVIDLNLRHSTFTSSTQMTEDALELEIGDRLTISNPPAWLPPDRIDLLAVGTVERYGVLERDVSVNCVAESAYHVGYVEGDDYERVDTDGSSLASSATSSATSLSVATQAGSAVWADSATYASDFPFDIRVGGEVMTVTAVTGTSSPQTFTVTRSVNGVTKAHDSGTDVRLAYPSIISL